MPRGRIRVAIVTAVTAPPEHSRRVFEALHGARQLILVPGVGHNQSLQGEVWLDIDRWIERALSAPKEPR